MIKTFEAYNDEIKKGDTVVRTNFAKTDFAKVGDRWDVFTVLEVLDDGERIFYELTHIETKQLHQSPQSFIRKMTKKDEMKLQANKYNI